jgi:rSAM/selenodomain-associated transferase 2
LGHCPYRDVFHVQRTEKAGVRNLLTFTVIIPTLNEAGVIASTLERTVSLGFHEIIVADGGSIDGTPAIVQSNLAGMPRHAAVSVRLISAAAGRARQLNAGAAVATGDVLLFLHADTQLPPHARRSLEQALADPAVVGGRFDVRFDRHCLWGRVISTLMNVRSRLTRISTGDQAIFVRRRTFEGLGGFSDIPIMEDIDFSAKLKRNGGIAALTDRVTTSFRRWERHGPMRTILLMWSLRFLYWIGVSPHRLAQFYANTR